MHGEQFVARAKANWNFMHEKKGGVCPSPSVQSVLSPSASRFRPTYPIYNPLIVRTTERERIMVPIIMHAYPHPARMSILQACWLYRRRVWIIEPGSSPTHARAESYAAWQCFTMKNLLNTAKNKREPSTKSIVQLSFLFCTSFSDRFLPRLLPRFRFCWFWRHRRFRWRRLSRHGLLRSHSITQSDEGYT